MNDYERKLQDLFVAMREQGFQPFFKGDADKALGTLHRHLDTMSRYIDRVLEQETLAAELDSDPTNKDLRTRMELSDNVRTSAHNAAMTSLDVVNRVFQGYGLEPFIVVEEGENRSSIGEKIASYVSVMLLGADGPLSCSDTAVLSRDLGLDHAARSTALQEFLQSLAQ